MAQMLSISRQCVAVIEPCPYLKGQGHTCSFSVCMLAFMSWLKFLYAWKDFEIKWHKCLAYQDDVSRDRTMPLPQTSRSHLQFQCLYACFRVRPVISLCIEGFLNNMTQVFSISRQCVA